MMIRAIRFPTANDYLLGGTTNPNAQSGVMPTIPNVPTNLGFLSYWIKYETPPAQGIASIRAFTTNGSYAANIQVFQDTLIIVAQDTTTNPPFLTQFNFAAVINNMPNVGDGQWHNFLWTWDTNTDTHNPTTGHVYIDNLRYTTSISGNGIPFSINLHNFVFNVGGSGTGANLSLAELFLLTGQSVNTDDATVRAKFIDPNTLLPVYLGTNGMVPFGSAPHLCMTGDADLFPANFASYARLPLVLTVDLNSPAASSFLAQGAPQPATNDPYGSIPMGTNVSASVSYASRITVTNGTHVNVASISLGAGEWDVNGNVEFVYPSGHGVNYVEGGVTTISAALNDNTPAQAYAGVDVPNTSTFTGLAIGTCHLSLAAPTTVYLTADIQGGGATAGQGVYGTIRATRVQ